MKTIIIVGPAGCGKTLHAEALRQHFQCTHIMDQWRPSDGYAPGALILTSMRPGGSPLPYTSETMDAYDFDQAMRLMNEAIARVLAR